MPEAQASAIVQSHVWVSGRVQGVGYRISTYEVAREAGLQGWVKNLPDGRVEAVFQGSAATVAEMIRWCHQGPPAAQVTQVEAIGEPPEPFTGFQIRR